MEKVYTEKAPAAIGPYSQAMKAGGLLFTSGQIPIDPATGAVAGENITAQTEQVMQNLGAVLEAAGTSFQRTVKTLCFLQTMDDFAAFNEVYARYFTEKPARSCVAVRTLPKGVLVEVEAIAELLGTAKRGDRSCIADHAAVNWSRKHVSAAAVGHRPRSRCRSSRLCRF